MGSAGGRVRKQWNEEGIPIGKENREQERQMPAMRASPQSLRDSWHLRFETCWKAMKSIG